MNSAARLPRCKRAAATMPDAVAPNFRTGDAVVVRVAFPIGHVRTPGYIRGKSGVIERYCGTYANPEELAYGRPGHPGQPLYRVRFIQREVWPDYRGGHEDSIDLEIYQHWLEAK